jgi:hypothetical protein
VFRSALFTLTLLSTLLFLPAQLGGQTRRLSQDSDIAGPRNPEEEARLKMERDMQKKRNEIRQKQIQQDSMKLLQLATELKEYVDKSNENILSMDVIKKADEIEKFAHSVKEKMKTAQ